MTKRATATQAQVRRNIKAARLEGLLVTGIKPDGTIVVHAEDGTVVPFPYQNHLDATSAPGNKWSNVRA
jgi:hypothetical protein